MSKPRKLPWINSTPKIINTEYFWVEEEKSRSNERKARSIRNYKTNIFKKKLLYLTNYVLRERSYNFYLLQPHKLDLTRKKKETITRTLKIPLNELRPIWLLQTLLSLQELIELKKIKHH